MPAAATKTAAWPLAVAYLALVVYASLFPFEGWRDQGLSTFEFLSAPLPRYWTGFDVLVNVLGYGPLGLLLAWSMSQRISTRSALLLAAGVCSLLSLTLEAAQTFLPGRVPSNLDWGLNTVGGALGAATSILLQRWGLLSGWQRWTRKWLVGEPRGAVVLLALWPLALLFPAALPFGLGQISARLDEVLSVLAQTMGVAWSAPETDQAAPPLAATTQWVCVVLGLAVPYLLAYSVMAAKRIRAVMLLGITAVGMVMMALSATLSYGPAHAWVWLIPTTQLAVLGALVLGTALLWCPRKLCLVLALVGLVFQLSVLNNIPIDSYLGQNLMAWEQGRFARFHGLAQWLAVIWPYAMAVYVGLRLTKRERPDDF